MSTESARDRPTLLPDLDEPALLWRAGLLDAVTTVLLINYLDSRWAAESNPLVSWFVEHHWGNPEATFGLYLNLGEVLLVAFGLKVMVTLACVWALRAGWRHVESVPYGPAYVRLLAYCYLVLGPLLNLWVLAQ